MCGLFGFSCYGEPVKNLTVLTNSLAEHSAVRGKDATGIAFCHKGIQIQKEAKSAYAMNIKHPDNIRVLIGHTRHTTHGDCRRNYNNHPFSGKIGKFRFALTHNGVLWNVATLRQMHKLPQTKIETDSYIAVQLIEQQNQLSMDSIRSMAETVQGSFSFSILDDRNSIYLVRGDNPLSILNFPEKRMYVYASTEEILYKSVVDSMLFEDLKKGGFTEVPIEEGTIMKINPDGTLEKEVFCYREFFGFSWWEYGGYSERKVRYENEEAEYLDILRTMAGYRGIEPEEIDALLDEGFTPEEVEEYLYEI